MTNEEIKQRTHALASKWWDEDKLSHKFAPSDHLEIASLIRDAVAQALEGAARATCLYCMREYELHQYAGGGWYHTDAEKNEWQCAGSKVRIHKDALNPPAPCAHR